MIMALCQKLSRSGRSCTVDAEEKYHLHIRLGEGTEFFPAQPSIFYEFKEAKKKTFDKDGQDR